MGGRDRGNGRSNVLADHVEGRAAEEGGRHVDDYTVALHVNIGNHAHLNHIDYRNFGINNRRQSPPDGSELGIGDLRLSIVD